MTVAETCRAVYSMTVTEILRALSLTEIGRTVYKVLPLWLIH